MIYIYYIEIHAQIFQMASIGNSESTQTGHIASTYTHTHTQNDHFAMEYELLSLFMHSYYYYLLLLFVYFMILSKMADK